MIKLPEAPARVASRLCAALATACAFMAGFAAEGPGFAAEPAIQPAPAFDGRTLSALPRDGWITNGGNVWNQRYSPLAGINRANVAGLKAEWRASLNGSGLNPRDGAQGQPIVYDGVIYVQTGENDAFAVSVETGRILWEFKAKVDETVAHPCCGWNGRGLALGEGKVFDGTFDGRLIALDQKTGKVVWSIQAEDPKLRYTIAAAPLYYDGMVITGFAGSDTGTRGRIKAYDARDGHLIWTFYTIPGPGEIGHDTWPKDSEVWKYGGAAIWQTPAVDPELGLIYFSTANAWPAYNGQLREGDNLFTASILALDVKTGKYRWHFQEVHHEIWDYDAPNPVILFDAPYKGMMRKGLAQAGKTGWIYILDRVTGKPLIGIPEKPVMQEPAQKTARTQPHPIGEAFVPQSFEGIAPENVTLVNDGRVFTPFARVRRFWKPANAAVWAPSAYDPASHLMYVCAVDSARGAIGADPNFPGTPGRGNFLELGEPVSIPQRGIVAAMDLTTNRAAWRQQWIEPCYSGALVTAGGLLFIGRSDGRFQALDKATGARLWEFQTDGGVNAPASTFEWKGKQYVVVMAGGTGLVAKSKHADGLWLFSLDGKVGPLPPGSADATAPAPTEPRAAGRPAHVPDAAAGKATFASVCATCHGAEGEGGSHGARLTNALTREVIVTVATRGRNDMPAFGAAMSQDQLQDVAAYIVQLARDRSP